MASAKLLGVLALALSAVQCHAQTILPSKPTDRTTISKIPQSTQDEFYSARRAVRRQNTPRIVFVPGILGSKIDECRADNSQCTNIWGTVEAIRRRNVDLSFSSDRTYRTDVVDSVLFKDFYGGALEYIRKKAELVVSDDANDPLVTVFHYDWRISNGENAKLLKERICLVRAHAEASPLVIVAHSMGGIITKVWAARHAKEPCTNGKEPNVTQIIFAATPHLGSPKAVKALAEGYNAFFDELTGFKRYLGYIESNYLLDAVNQAGISFPSLYELLPIRTSEYCTQQKPALAAASVPVVGDDGKPVNLFDVDTWRRYDLLRRIGTPPVRRSYYEHDLAKQLRQAEQLLCEIADFNPATVADVVYLFGREKTDRTYGWFHLQSNASSSIQEWTTLQGDGTVPVYSAQNFLVSSTRQIMEVEADHTSIVSSTRMLGLIDDLYSKAVRRADLQTIRANAQFASLLIAETAASGHLIPVSLDPNTWKEDDEGLAIEINKKALTLNGSTATTVAKEASKSTDASERAMLYAIAASSTDDKSQQLAWIGDVALSSYDAGRFRDAISNASFVSATAPAVLSPNDAERERLQKEVEQVKGWAYLRDGDVGKFNELASSYAAKYAVTKDEFREPTSQPVGGGTEYGRALRYDPNPAYGDPPVAAYPPSTYPLYGPPPVAAYTYQPPRYYVPTPMGVYPSPTHPLYRNPPVDSARAMRRPPAAFGTEYDRRGWKMVR
jgi:pimeloyl-ACP methyl ester carboxylesterase